MAIRVDAYTSGGMASGTLARPGALRDALEEDRALRLDGAAWQGLLIGAAALLAATLGDLTESMIKRDLQIKDMGSVLPGHGGVLDRIDSLALAAPVVWLLLLAFIPVAGQG